eukprot:c22568_g1_i2 orf=495-3113(+)
MRWLLNWDGYRRGYSPWQNSLIVLDLAILVIGTMAWSLAGSGLVVSSAGAPEGIDDEGGGDWRPPETWYGNIQYLVNLSIIGAGCCVVLFLLVKLRSDHHLPGLSSLATKLLAVWHTTGLQMALLSGANASQYLAVGGYSFLGLFATALVAILLLLPLNLYGGTVALQDQFLKSTVIHIEKASPLLWGHFFFMLVVVGVMHLCIQALEQRLLSTRFHDGQTSDSVSAFTLMIRGIPRTMAMDKRPLQEYFEHSYCGKVYRVIIPPDLSAFRSLARKLVKKRKQLSWMQAKIRGRALASEAASFFLDYEEDASDYVDLAEESAASLRGPKRIWNLCKSRIKRSWQWILEHVGLGEDDRLRRLQSVCAELESKVLLYREGRAPGAGIAFIIFKDAYTASRALQDARFRPKRMASVTELQLARSHWKVERAPPARDIYWHHLGTSTISRYARRLAVNVFLLLLLLFCSSPSAAFIALHSAGRLINPEAMDNVNLWLAWVQSSSWAAAVILQFLPNVLIFISMYLVIPAALAYLSSFESHLTVSGEQCAALVKTVLFFLVNLIILRGLLETTLEAALVRMGRCYVEGEECKDIEQYMSSSFLANSSLSAMAFLITSSFLGVSYDLLSPIPWIKRKILQFRMDAVPDYVPEGSSLNYTTIQEESLHEGLLPGDSFSFPGMEPAINRIGSLNRLDLHGQDQDLSAYPLVTDISWRAQVFDYAQYHAFNLTIFALVLIYSTFVPVIVPIGALYFGYRYIVDKYNFLFVYRVRGFPATNDGKLMGTVLRVMRVCIVLYLLAMLLFFSVRGDHDKLQLLCTFGLLVIVCVKYGIEKLVSPPKDGFDLSDIQSVGSIDSVVDEPVEYEAFARPNFEWDIPGT